MNTLKLFFACILLLAGLLVLPFAVIGGMATGLLPVLLVFLLGGSPLYIIYLLWQDDFGSLAREEEGRVKQVALLCSFLGIAGQIGLRIGYGYSGTALYSEFMLGSTEATPLALVLFFLTAVISAVSAMPVFLWAIRYTDFFHHDYVIITQTMKGEEVSREYGSSSVERPFLTVVALITAILGLLSTHVLLLFVILGINLSLFMPTVRSARAMRALAIIGGVVAFLATHGNVGSDDPGVALALDFWPILLFGVAALILWLADTGRIYTFGMCMIFFGSFFVTWIIAFLSSMALEEAFPIPLSGIAKYIFLGFTVLAVVLSILAMRSVKKVLDILNRKGKKDVRRWRTLALLVLLLSVLFVGTVLGVLKVSDLSEFSLSSLFPRRETVTVEYTLYPNATFTQNGVCYGISDKGVIALYVADKSAKSITLAGWDGQMPESMTDKAEELLYADKAKYTGKVYAVAENFLYGDHTIEKLTTAGEITYFADGCIKSSQNLKKIVLSHTVPATLEGGFACNKEAFSISKNCELVVGDLNEVIGYVTSLDAYEGRLVYADDVYYTVTYGVHMWHASADLLKEYCEASGSFSATARVLGVRSTSLSGTLSGKKDGNTADFYCSDKVKVFEKGDKVRYRAEKDELKANCSANGAVVLKAWILENSSASFSGSGTLETRSLGSAEMDFQGETFAEGWIRGRLVYGAD